MGYVKRIICLANSLKVGGSCVAGREILANGHYGNWIRPVSTRPTAELSFMETLYENNESPKLLDIIDVPLERAAPHRHQTENDEIDVSSPWRKVGELPWTELAKLSEHPPSLWVNSDRTSGGSYNCMSREEASTLTTSLLLIAMNAVTIQVASVGRLGDSRQSIKSSFHYNGTYHSLNMTDPTASDRFGRQGNGQYRINDVYLCISLTEPWARDNHRCHKVVASIMSNTSL